MKARRGPWLSGLIAALALMVWMVGQVIGGMLAMTADMLSTFPSGPAPGIGSTSTGFAP